MFANFFLSFFLRIIERLLIELLLWLRIQKMSVMCCFCTNSPDLTLNQKKTDT